jgi:hypothetical protein
VKVLHKSHAEADHTKTLLMEFPFDSHKQASMKPTLSRVTFFTSFEQKIMFSRMDDDSRELILENASMDLLLLLLHDKREDALQKGESCNQT